MRVARHNCRLWTSLGFSCPGGVLDRGRQRKVGFEPDKQQLPRVSPMHEFSEKVIGGPERWVFVQIMRKIVRFLKLGKPEEFTIRKMEPVRARDIPIEEIVKSVPIPEIIMTGAAAAAIMAAERAFGGRAERFVTEVMARQGKGRTSTAPARGGGTVGKGVAGTGFRFNAVDELAGKIKELRRKGGGASGEFFPGILG